MDGLAVINAVHKRGYIGLSQDEVTALETIHQSDVRAASILAAHFFNTGQFKAAVTYAGQVAEQTRTPEAELGYISALEKSKRYKDAIQRAMRADSPISDLQRATRLSEIYGQIKQPKHAIHWGQKALALKDASVPELDQPRPSKLHQFCVDTPERNIISYSLYGKNPRYLDGALRNVIVTRYLYPGWTPRFYVDDSVPEATIKGLRREGAQVHNVQNWPAHRYGLYWRFLVEDDPDVDFYLVRDADSVPNIRERACVTQWLESDLPFHVMRDGPTHSELILAGMWGAHRGNIGNILSLIQNFENKRKKIINSRIFDQEFLRQQVWPFMRGRVCCHDPIFEYGKTHDVGPAYTLPKGMRIGQNDHVTRAKK